MKKNNLKLLIPSAIMMLAFSMPSSIQGTETLSTGSEYQKILKIQLQKMADDTLEAVLGSGNNVLLKISMDLKILKEPVEQEQVAVPVRLFLTDFMSTPINHAPVPLEVKVDCEWTPLCVLPNKPLSFESYSQFTDWLKQGYFTNENRIAYDFHVDIHKAAPSLVQHLFVTPPGGYHFAGTYATHNAKIIADRCIPNVAYHSQRGSANTTTLTLGGIFYLNKKPYPISDHHQIFPHSMIEQKEFKRDQTKKFYHHHWLAESEVTTIEVYSEFPGSHLINWPDAPCETYSLLRQKPGDIKEISHLACWDASTGEAIDIGSEKIFLLEPEGNKERNSEHLESIVADEGGKLFIVRYVYSKPNEESSLEPLEKEAEKLTIALAAKREIKKEKAREAGKKGIEDLKKQQEEIQKELLADEMEKRDLKGALVIAQQNIADLKKQLEDTQRAVGDLRKFQDAEITQRAAEAEERQRVEQEAEQRQRNEQIKAVLVAEYNSSIKAMIQHIQALQNYQLTYGELVKVLEAMEEYYRGKPDEENYQRWREEEIRQAWGIQSLTTYKNLKGTLSLVGQAHHQVREKSSLYKPLIKLLTRDVIEKMGKYHQLNGAPHPLRNKFSNK